MAKRGAAKPKSKKVKKVFSKKELDDYKEKLLNLKEDVLDQIREISKETLMKSQKDMSGDISGYSLHLADVASDNYERDFNLNLVSSERKILLEIEEALHRIKDGTYGICQMSGKSITKSRLNAIPYAKYSKKCQEQLEKENKI
jgi:DnaK suppressor protein